MLSIIEKTDDILTIIVLFPLFLCHRNWYETVADN